MTHKAARQPRVSILLAVHDARDVAARTVESILNQEYRDLELIVADCASRDYTATILQRYAERDIRVELLRLDGADVAAGRDAALAAAHGTFALFMDQGDWLASGCLDSLVAAAEESSAQLAIPAFSIDSTRSDGSRTSTVCAPASQVWGDARSFRKDFGRLLADRLFLNTAGKLMRVSRLRDQHLRFSQANGDFDLMASYLRHVERVCVVQGPCCHVSASATGWCRGTGPGPLSYKQVERDYERVLSLYRSWGLIDDAESMEEVHRLHLSEVIRCIGEVAVDSHSLSPIERRRAVQGMIDAPSTRDSIEALRPQARDFGIMFAPIARRSAAACCMGARIQDIVERTLAPFTPARAACRCFS